MTRSDYFRPVRGGISGLCEEADDKSIWRTRDAGLAATRCTARQDSYLEIGKARFRILL